MKLSQKTWSYVLLVAYAIVFGHQVIPHHHRDLNVFHNHHHNGLMDHCVSEKETHSHIAYNEHFDEGIWDYIGCLIAHDKHSPVEDEYKEHLLDDRFSKTQNADQAIISARRRHYRTFSGQI